MDSRKRHAVVAPGPGPSDINKQGLDGPFLWRTPGNVACLLIHGFTGSPYDMRPLGRALVRAGITAYGIRLPGHGTEPADLRFVKAWDLVEKSDEGYYGLADKKYVFIGGLSMGGALSFITAARHEGDPKLRGVISLATPLYVADWRARFGPYLWPVIPWHTNDPNDVSVKDPAQRRRPGITYDRWPVKALSAFLGVTKQARKALPKMTTPLFIAQAHEDPTVPQANADLIASLAGSTDKKILWLENSYHVITRDYDHELMEREIIAWMQAHLPKDAQLAPGEPPE